MKKILFFNEIDRNLVKKVGGKGANLGELYSNGFKVPSGFCITTDFYDEFIKKIKIDYPSLTRDIKKNSKFIRDTILSHEFSDDLRRELEKGIASIKGIFFAVRSSATNEDNPNNSFAGQMDTYLNIEKKDIISNVKKCIASLFTERACSYRNMIISPMRKLRSQ